jgi:hypothetical protein
VEVGANFVGVHVYVEARVDLTTTEVAVIALLWTVGAKGVNVKPETPLTNSTKTSPKRQKPARE